MTKLGKVLFSLLCTLGMSFVLESRVKAWDNVNGGDHGGSDWTISTNTTVAGVHTNVGTFTVNEGITASVQSYNGSSYGSFQITATSANIQGSINAGGAGYAPVAGDTGSGPGGGQGNCAAVGGAGGGHGGIGGSGLAGNAGGQAYDNYLSPTQMGSAGGGTFAGGCIAGGYGGGAIMLNVPTGTVTISGSLLAAGGSPAARAGGGAGGSIYVVASTIAGSGTIASNGGNAAAEGGSGAGGRIALKYSTNYTYNGSLTATGGSSYYYTGQNGTIVIVNSTTNDLIIPSTQFWSANPSLEGSTQTFRNVSLTNNSTLYVMGYYTTNDDGVGLSFNVNDFTINSGSSIEGSGYGYQGISCATGSGPSPGQGSSGADLSAGGGHGGNGGNGQNGKTGGGTVGSSTAPTLLGSAGGGAIDNGCRSGTAGGSAIKINALGTITVSGTITMNGSDTGVTRPGTGAGGSVYLIANVLQGSANISARGGNANQGGSGGGGRVSLNYRVSNSYSGTVSVVAGSSYISAGSAGTSTVSTLPQSPSSLSQYRSDGSTAIESGATTSEATVVLKSTMSAGGNATLREEIEIVPIATSFTNEPTATGSGSPFTGTPITGSVTISSLTDSTNYHWQVRVCDQDNNCSSWASYGGSPYDFRVFTNQTPNAPSALGPTDYTNGSSVSDSTPTFTFTQSDPDAGNTEFYTIQVSSVSDYSTLVLQYDSALIAQGGASFTVGQLAGSGIYSQGGSAGQSLVNGSYYWRVKSTDNVGATSGWSQGRIGSNAFVVDSSAPSSNAQSIAFSNATSGNWTNSEPRLTWTSGTDSSGSLLGYCLSLSEATIGDATPSDDPANTAGVLQGIDDGISQSYCPFIVTGTNVDLSLINGLSLTSNKQYYISIKAVDNAGNIYSGSAQTYQNILNFKYDAVVPTNVASISAAGGTFSNIADMYFSWPTSGGIAASDSESGLLGYQYSLNDQTHWTGIANDPGTGLDIVPAATTTPFYLSVSRDLTQIIVGTNIIYFRTVDIAGNTSSSGTYRTASIVYGGDAPTFAPDAEFVVTPSVGTENSFALSWDAATPATNRSITKYYWMVNTVPPATLQTMIDNPGTYFETTSTSIAAAALPAVVRGSNTVYVVAIDDLSNYSPSSFIDQSFTLNTTSPDSPKDVSVSDASIKSASLWRASLAWGTPDYVGLGNLIYTIQRSSDGSTWTTVGSTSGTAYVDTVSESSRYYWRVGTKDSGGTGNAAPSYSNSVTLIPKGSYTSAAELTSGPTVSNITTKKAKITWTTGRTSDSKVAYGSETGKYYDEEPSNSNQVTDHTINLVNLSPNTTYYYQAKWTDEDGNTGTTSEKSFSTSSAPIIKEVTVDDISLTSALIKFTTIHADKVKIYYGVSTDFGGSQTLSTSSVESGYTISLSNLQDGTKYYYRINGFDSEDTEYVGDIYSFETLPRPKISAINLQQVAGTAESTISVTWASNTEITSVITYYPDGKETESRNVIDLTLKNGDHSLIVKGLLPHTAYNLIVRGNDRMGNEARSAPISFTTASDTRPPSIVNLKVIGGTIPPVGFAAGTINAQLVVTWDTDEPASSQVEYSEGTGSDYSSKSTEDGNLTTNHVVVISGLTPSQVYHLRAVSKDSANNDGHSVDTVTIAPKATRSALDLVLSNLSQIFGSISIVNK